MRFIYLDYNTELRLLLDNLRIPAIIVVAKDRRKVILSLAVSKMGFKVRTKITSIKKLHTGDGEDCYGSAHP